MSIMPKVIDNARATTIQSITITDEHRTKPPTILFSRDQVREVNALNCKQDELMLFDPCDGTARPYPSHAEQYRKWHGQDAWLYNPWLGTKRSPGDIGTDVFGRLIAHA